MKITEKTIQELSEVFQSSNINFLFGAGTSMPFFPRLGNIETALNATTDQLEREKHLKEYYSGVMLPNKEVINKDLTSNENFMSTRASYSNFFSALINLLLQRKNTILSKQVNLFTTNIDILMEKFLEELNVEYNDGFCGKFTPTFNLANFKKAIYQRSMHFDHISEIPVFNIIKIHGSVSWKGIEEKIVFSDKLSHISDELGTKTGTDFLREYKKILVVNPEEAKHLESVLNLYYSELLRMYSSELEKENSTMFIIGFSMEDKHIREITLRAARANPTLRIFVCCSDSTEKSMGKKLEIDQHPNIQLFSPQDNKAKFTLSYFTENVLKKIDSKEGNEGDD